MSMIPFDAQKGAIHEWKSITKNLNALAPSKKSANQQKSLSLLCFSPVNSGKNRKPNINGHRRSASARAM
jgi:hypothetical protein